MPRYVCIHGHFYQPPRENPWLEAIEQQDSASPYHDWNERITHECYRTNASARVLDQEGWIVRLVSNYARISFNFGATLLSWMQEQAPDVYAGVLEADRRSAQRFGGHGSAIAQGYNHMILPLANERDRRTQVVWGIRDFEHRFGRRPEGMWLPETGVDTPTLEALAEQGIRFTVLAPRQAKRTRALRTPDGGGPGAWRDCADEGVDPRRAYLCRLPSGRSIALFFYDGPISQGVAFEGLLQSGERLEGRLTGAFRPDDGEAQLVHIATDGETFGHHHRFGEMALAYALLRIEGRVGDVELTNYGRFLELHPPEHEAEIVENSSWSCVHGVERWRSDCGCRTGRTPSGDQAWRAPLREALDWLRDRLAGAFEQAGGRVFKDPWGARDRYISVINNRSEASVDDFLTRHGRGSLSGADAVRALQLMEMQRHAMLMYTSCGWFFDDLSGIETVQVIMYAARAMQLAREAAGADLEEGFLKRLERARCNPPDGRTGRQLYEDEVRPAIVDLPHVAAHFAVSTLFDEPPSAGRVYCYDVEQRDLRRLRAGRTQVRIGRAVLRSRLTRKTGEVSFAVLHLGEHIIHGGARLTLGDAEYERMAASIDAALGSGDVAELLRVMEESFGTSRYSLTSLFRDEQRRIVNRVLDDTVERLTASFREIHRDAEPLVRFLAGHRLPIPPALLVPAQHVLNADLSWALEDTRPDAKTVLRILSEAKRDGVEIDRRQQTLVVQRRLAELAARVAKGETSGIAAVEELEALVEAAGLMPFEIDLGMAQQAFGQLMRAPGGIASPSEAPGVRGVSASRVEALAQRLRVRLGAAVHA